MPMQIEINNQYVDISHLREISRTMTLDLRGGMQKKNARLEFRFSCHCYSRGPKEGESIPPGMLVADGSAHKPRNRIFCQNRYDLSLQLVQKIENLIQTNGLVEKSRHLNFFATYLAAPGEGGELEQLPYYVFMKAGKKQDPNQPPKLDIFVESAYPGDPLIPAPDRMGEAVSLSVMLGKVWEKGHL